MEGNNIYKFYNINLKLSSMKKKIIYGLLLAVAMVTASSSFVSCKDYEGDDYAALTEKNAALEAYLNSQIQALQNAIARCGTNCTEARTILETRLKEWVEAQGYLKEHQSLEGYAREQWVINYLRDNGYINSLDGYATEAWVQGQNYATQEWVTLQNYATQAWTIEQISENNEAFVNAVNAILAQKGYLTQDDLANYYTKGEIDDKLRNLTNYATLKDLDDLRNAIILGDSVRHAYEWASYVYQRIVAQGDSLKYAYEQSKANKDSLLALGDSINNVEQRALANFNAAKALADSAKILANQALDSCNIVDAKVNDLVIAYQDADSKLQDQIDSLAIVTRILENQINNIMGTLKKQITGVIIQATYSPVLGNGSLPFSLQTNLLAAYAGKSTADATFPSPYDEDYADGTTVITPSDQAYLQGLGFWPGEVSVTKGDYIISDREDNAGKVYLTVNPTNTDFTGTTFDMVNSAGQVSRMELSDLKPCKEVLNFGWTRAGASASTNGFYEASAKVTKDNIEKLQANINVEMFRKAFKENLNSPKEGTGYVSYTAMMDLARAVYSSLEPLQRNGIRATWMDDAAGVNRSYTSAFDIAATVVNPLGFGFTIPENKYTRFPVFDTEYLKNRFHLKGECKLLVAKSKESGENVIFCEVLQMNLDPELKEVYYDADGNPILMYNGRAVYYDTDWYDIYNFYGYEVRTGYAYIDMTELYEEIYGEINTGFATVNDLVKQANKRIDYMVSFIDRYNRKAVKANNWIKNANNLLQPVLLWCDSENVGLLGGMLSGNYAVGTIIPAGGSVALVPTSYTLELLAPAYKKSIVVTNVYRDGKSAQGVKGSDWQDALVAVNEALKDGGFDLFEGQSLKNAFIFEAKPEYAGMTFEFAYTALDYTGQVAGRKFYLTVE